MDMLLAEKLYRVSKAYFKCYNDSDDAETKRGIITNAIKIIIDEYDDYVALKYKDKLTKSSVMDNKLRQKLVEQCSGVLTKVSDEVCNTMEEGFDYDTVVENATGRVVDKCVQVYEEETGCLPFSSDVVYFSIPFDDVKKAKEAAFSACNPLVTYNDDFEVMKEERDKVRETDIQFLKSWLWGLLP